MASRTGIRISGHYVVSINTMPFHTCNESFNDWGGRGYDDSVPGVVTKTATSEDRTARSSMWSASLT